MQSFGLLALPALALAGLAPAACAQSPLHGVQPAISSHLSIEDVAEAFEQAVVRICAPAVSGGLRPSALEPSARALLSPSTDPAARAQAGAAPEDAVWDMTSAKGVVLIHERPGRCVVSAYGPQAAITLSAVAKRIEASGQGFERLFAAPTSGIGESLVKSGTPRVQVILSGAEPGMPNHQSRFSVITATVFITPG